MTATGFVMLILVSLLFYEWAHPISLLSINKIIKPKQAQWFYLLGMIMFIIFGIGIWWISTKAETTTEQTLVLGIVIALMLLYNTFWFVLYLIKCKNTIKKEYVTLIFTFLVNLMLWALLIIDAINSYNVNEPIFSTLSYLVFNDQTPIFETMMNVIAIFSIVILSGYIVMLSVLKSSIVNYESINKEKMIKRINTLESLELYALVLGVAFIFSFFYFAEFDISQLSQPNVEIFDRLNSVFHLLASSLLIPVVLSFLLKDRK